MSLLSLHAKKKKKHGILTSIGMGSFCFCPVQCTVYNTANDESVHEPLSRDMMTWCVPL